MKKIFIIAMMVMMTSTFVRGAEHKDQNSELVRNPFNKMSAHHRPIGAGAEYGIPPSCDIRDFAKKKYTVLSKPGPLDDNSALQERLGAFRIGKTDQGRKYTYPVSPSDPVETMYECTPTFPAKRLGPTFKIRIPKGSNKRGGTELYYPPFDGGDFEYGFAYKDGGPDPIMIRFSDFDYTRKQYTSVNEYRLDGSDTKESPGGTCGASRLRWPGLVLQGWEINSENPEPIHHAFMCTGTRHNRQKADEGAHILNMGIVWPASGIDASANPLGKQYRKQIQNQGILPYGTRLCIRPQDYEKISKEIGPANKRGQVMLEAMVYYGCYLVDGQGQYVTDHGKKKGVLQMRVDGLFAQKVNGEKIPGVHEDVDAALEKMRPYLYPLRNPRSWEKESEIWTDGLPYAGGGGPLDPKKSVNNAWDAQQSVVSAKPQ